MAESSTAALPEAAAVPSTPAPLEAPQDTVAEAVTPPPAPKPAKPERLVSLDAYRGFIMLAMASGGLGFVAVIRLAGRSLGQLVGTQFAPLPGVGEVGLAAFDPHLPMSPLWQTLAYQFDHVAWVGCAFWDLIQPSFMFMVGVAMPYSHAARLAKGQSTATIWKHVFIRSLILILLGIFLSSNWSKQTNFTFVNVLTQIGLGYACTHLFLGRGLKAQLAGLAAILVGYWAYFVLTPVTWPADVRAYGLPADWPLLDGLAAHWNKDLNAAATFDQWFLNLFPREQTFWFSSGGYQTLNFIPSMATMLLGVIAGELLRADALRTRKFVQLLVAGFICFGLGLLAGATICPLVKRIWTPSWALYSTAFCFWMLAAFYGVVDVLGWQRWTFPLVVVGMNSIAIYVMAQLTKPWVRDTLRIHFGKDVFDGTYFGLQLFHPVYAPIAEAVLMLGVWWLACWWLYRQKIFIKI